MTVNFSKEAFIQNIKSFSPEAWKLHTRSLLAPEAFNLLTRITMNILKSLEGSHQKRENVSPEARRLLTEAWKLLTRGLKATHPDTLKLLNEHLNVSHQQLENSSPRN